MTATDEALLRLLSGPVAPPTSPTRTAAPTPRRTDEMPEHVKRTLANRGDLDPTTGASHNARIVRCQTCRRPVFLGLIVGLVYVCDTYAISPMAEALALLLGRRTFTIRFGTDRMSLDWRGKWAPPIGSRDVDVLVQHHCHDPVEFERIPSVADRRLIQPTPEQPPF